MLPRRLATEPHYAGGLTGSGDAPRPPAARHSNWLWLLPPDDNNHNKFRWGDQRVGSLAVRALILRHHVEDRMGFVGDGLLARGADLVDLLVTATSPFPDPASFDAAVVLGAADAVYNPRALAGRVEDELSFLRAANASATPILGICFGAQALTVAIGGEVRPMPSMEIGWCTIETAAPDLVGPGPWLTFHGDHCLPSADAEVVARTEMCVQAFTVGPHLGVQFHPEVDAAQLRAWFDAGSDDQVTAHGIDPSTLLAETTAQETAARNRAQVLVNAFLTHANLTER